MSPQHTIYTFEPNPLRVSRGISATMRHPGTSQDHPAPSLSPELPPVSCTLP